MVMGLGLLISSPAKFSPFLDISTVMSYNTYCIYMQQRSTLYYCTWFMILYVNFWLRYHKMAYFTDVHVHTHTNTHTHTHAHTHTMQSKYFHECISLYITYILDVYIYMYIHVRIIIIIFYNYIPDLLCMYVSMHESSWITAQLYMYTCTLMSLK